ncbi:MAG: hypothetical protein QF886_26535, partial [Planctomycetota bacterium]|nr:hypothetical protein [Planctomycetota bacterium]
MSDSDLLTAQIKSLLEKVRHKERRLRHARGAVFFLAFLILLTLAGAICDRFVPATEATRWLMAITAYVVTLLALYIIWLRKAVQKISYEEAAWIVEKNFDELDEKLISTVELSHQDSKESHLSLAMIHAVAKSMSQQTSSVPMERISPLSMIRKPAMILGAMIAVYVILTLIPAIRIHRLSARFWFPAVRYGRVGNFELEALNAHKDRIGRGDPYEFDIVSTSPEVEAVRVNISLANGLERSKEIYPDADGHFRFIFTETLDNFTYQASARDVST